MHARSLRIAASIGLVAAALAPGGARAVGPGCHPETPAIAHRGDAAVLDPQPAGGPIPCRMYTGYAGGESRIEVGPDGTVFFSPAPFLRGALSLGYTPDEEPTGEQWMFQQGGIAISRDSGASWQYVEPSDATYTMDDAHSFLDRETGRYFWNVLNQSPETEDPPNSPTAAVPLYEGQVLSTPNGGASWTHATAFGPVDDRPELMAGRPPAGQPVPTGYSNVVYHCYMFSGNGICSKSLDGGASFTLAGFKHRSGLLPVHPQCGGLGDTDEVSGSMTAACDGSLYTPVWCDEGNFLSRSSDEASSWSVVAQLPADWDLGSDRAAGLIHSDAAGNLYMMRRVEEYKLLLSVSADGGHTWSAGVNVTAPGVIRVHENWYFDVRNPGHVSVTYNGRRAGQTTTYDGFLTATRDALALVGGESPMFWSAMINDPSLPLLYGEALVGVGLDVPVTPEHDGGPPPQVNQSGADIAPNGDAWGSFTEDCGSDPDQPRCEEQHGQTRGLAARLAWPERAPDLDLDRDADGIGRCDNCAIRANAGQEDSGGVGSNAPDGIGNACQCGDVTGNGVVDGQDALAIQRKTLGLSPNPLFAVPEHCDVTGNGVCNGQDASAVKQALLGDPSSLQHCQSADPNAPPCANCAP
jgi:hypothetical protein